MEISCVNAKTALGPQKIFLASCWAFAANDPAPRLGCGRVNTRTASGELFPGQHFDKETNTNYNWHRTYDPSLGRYLQSDPIGLGDRPNTYTYAYDNPVNYIGPTGKSGAAAGLCFIPGVSWGGDVPQPLSEAGLRAAGSACALHSE